MRGSIISLIIVTIVSVFAVAGIVSYFSRSTTFMEEKYLNRPSADIDELYVDPIKNLEEDGNYSDDIIKSGEFTYVAPCTPGQDTDGDGIMDEDELLLGLDCRNPDTDGDNIIDGQDIEPLDFNTGADSTPFLFGPEKPDEPDAESGSLLVKDFYKNAYNSTQDETEWSDYIQANPEDYIQFMIYLELENTDPEEAKYANLTDVFNLDEIEYTNNLRVFIDNQEQAYDELLDQNWYKGYQVVVPPKETHSYRLFFTGQITITPPNQIVINNLAKLDVGYDTLFEPVFIGIS